MPVTDEPKSDGDSPSGQSAAEHAEPHDNRRAPRRRMLKAGIIAFNRRFATLPCAVRDLSETGALLRMSGVANVPDHFELIVELDGLEADCEVVWRQGRDLGVRFSAPPRKVPPRRAQAFGPLNTAPARPLLRSPR